MHWEGTAKPVLLAAAAALKGFSYVISNDLGSFCNCHHRVALPPFPMSGEQSSSPDKPPATNRLFCLSLSRVGWGWSKGCLFHM